MADAAPMAHPMAAKCVGAATAAMIAKGVKGRESVRFRACIFVLGLQEIEWVIRATRAAGARMDTAFLRLGPLSTCFGCHRRAGVTPHKFLTGAPS
jgi:hypothetical protein